MRRARDGEDGKPGESRVVEKITKELPQSYIDQLEAIKAALEKFKDSQEFVLPKAFQELVERVDTMERVAFDICRRLELLENRPVDVTPVSEPVDLTPLVDRIAVLEQTVPTEPAELQDNVKTLSSVVADSSEATLRHFAEQQREIEALKGIVRRLDIQLETFLRDVERA
jgi:hypothetical protein